MSSAENKNLQKTNAIYWLAAMAVPIILDLGLKAIATGPVNFPWTITIPFLFVGLLLASNKLIAAAGGTAEVTKSPSSTIAS